MNAFFSNPPLVFLAAALLRVALFFFGAWQDAHSPMKYTDIDYYVFTDASNFVAQNKSPYERETYRYTPLLAWMLQPTAWSGVWFSFGKAVFATSDIVIGWLTVLILCSSAKMSRERSLKLASIWLLNPMVAIISTRGSSESVLGVMVIVLLWAVMQRRALFAGVVLGLGVHFKIYPFFYATSIIWWLDDQNLGLLSNPSKTLLEKIRGFFNTARLKLAVASVSTFFTLNLVMYLVYVT
jgi:GPI mannosyltransferase 1 subunit M